MNKYVYMMTRIITILAYLAILVCIVNGYDGTVELFFCSLATVGSFIVFKQKRKKTKN